MVLLTRKFLLMYMQWGRLNYGVSGYMLYRTLRLDGYRLL